MSCKASELVEHYFRHEYGRLVSVLTRTFGFRHIDLAEDVAQSALSYALQHWSRNGVPNNPGGWLFRVATRLATDALRRESMESRHLSGIYAASNETNDSKSEVPQLVEESEDDQFRLLLACCHPDLPHSSSVALALKVMGGFSVAEIAHALLTTEANVQKRITRAKEKLRECVVLVDSEVTNPLDDRIDAVMMVIYLLFNEGYLSSHSEVSIRRDLCDESKRLARILVAHLGRKRPSAYALLALMSFHIARLDTRTDSAGEVLLLEHQDRAKWNWQDIREGMDWMQQSAAGSELSRFHIEAAIAWEHCRSQRFEGTDWHKIRDFYELLMHRVSSPVQWLNQAIAEYYCNGPRSALQMIQNIPRESHPKEYPIWHAVIGFLYHKDGNDEAAKQHWIEALRCTHSRAEQELLRRRIASCRTTC